MAPSLRSAWTDHPNLGTSRVDVAVECSMIDVGGKGEGWFLRTRWRGSAEGMLANCLLSMGIVLLLVQCALAIEGKHTSSSCPLG